MFAPIAPDGHRAPVVAFMNPGGIRADLIENGDGDVTYGAAFEVQPFSNFMASFDLTGAQIKEVLNEQWNGANEATTEDPPGLGPVLHLGHLGRRADRRGRDPRVTS